MQLRAVPDLGLLSTAIPGQAKLRLGDISSSSIPREAAGGERFR